MTNVLKTCHPYGIRKHRASTLAACLLAALIAPLDEANAVELNPNGIGQVLIFPYYTVNGGNQTVVSVTNTTGKVKAVRVRFREARNGRSMMEFNLYLSPYHTWSGAVVLPVGDDSTPARLISQDRACTIPMIDAVARPMGSDFRDYDFGSFDYPSNLAATLGSPARTREGYIEMIEMGELRAGPGLLQLADEATPLPGSEVPVDCNAVLGAWLFTTRRISWSTDSTQEIDLPTGGLRGQVDIVDVAEGTMLSVPVTALTDFYTDTSAPGKLHQSVGAGSTTLKNANNGQGIARGVAVLSNGQRIVETFPADRAIEAVSLTMMKSQVMNEYLIDPVLGAATEWVMTYPTKRFYIERGSRLLNGHFFSDVFYDDGKAIIPQSAFVLNRMGRRGTSIQGSCCGGVCGVVPTCDAVPPRANNSANVFFFSSGSVSLPTRTPILGARMGEVADVIYTSISLAGLPTPLSGWATLYNGNPDTETYQSYFLEGPTTRNRYFGLPVIGFAATRIINTSLAGGVLANYAGTTPLRGALEMGPGFP